MNYEFSILNLKHHHTTRRTTMSKFAKSILTLFTFALLYLYTFPLMARAETPTPSPVVSATPTQTNTATPFPMRKYAPKVTVIPNPASGTKLSFRVMAPGPCKVRIRVTNRFFDVVARFEKEGSSLFDIIWSLKTVSEGIYYYQAQIEDKATGQVTQLPLQKFVVLKSEN